MSRLKHRIDRLEKSTASGRLTPAEAMELGRLLQGAALIPGKYPEHVDYKPDEAEVPTRKPNKRLDELINKMAAACNSGRANPT